MKELKVGIIGCGAISSIHIESVLASKNGQLISVCDIKEDRARSASEKYDCKYYTDYKEMLDKEPLDVVHICTPHYLHAPMAIYAAGKGINVLTEKPMAIKLEDADLMIKACKDNNVTLGVIFQNRYNAGSLLVKDTLKSGQLGKILSGRLNVYWYRSDEYYSSDEWRGTWDKEGGGVIINQAIHTMDLLRWFVDSPIDYVEANISNRAHPTIEVEDCAEGLIRYKNGVNTVFHALTYNSYDAPIEIELHCEKGFVRLVSDKATITFDDGREFSADRDPRVQMSYSSGAKSYWGVNHSIQVNDYYESLLKGEKPFIDGEEARKTQALICAIYQSGKERKRVFFNNN